MKNINFTDWQDIWLKKDIEGISRKMDRISIFNLVVLIEITIAIVALAIGVISIINDGIERTTLICIIVIPIGILILVPLIYCGFRFGKKVCSAIHLIKNNSMNVKPYIDKFDNEICNRIMMAYSLHENISQENKSEANCYYICETSYYINRCINEFIQMGSMKKHIFGNKKYKQVAPHRLLLVINLILELRKEINAKINTLDLSNNKIIDNIIVENNEYDKIFNDFINEINIIFGNAKVTDIQIS